MDPGDQAGSSWARRAAAPATSGEAIDVPLMIWNVSPGRAPVAGVGVSAARMLTPGAPRSGLAMSGTAVSGPREEKAAIRSPAAPAGCPPPRDSVTGAPPATSALMAAPSAAEPGDDRERRLERAPERGGRHRRDPRHAGRRPDGARLRPVVAGGVGHEHAGGGRPQEGPLHRPEDRRGRRADRVVDDVDPVGHR